MFLLCSVSSFLWKLAKNLKGRMIYLRSVHLPFPFLGQTVELHQFSSFFCRDWTSRPNVGQISLPRVDGFQLQEWKSDTQTVGREVTLTKIFSQNHHFVEFHPISTTFRTLVRKVLLLVILHPGAHKVHEFLLIQGDGMVLNFFRSVAPLKHLVICFWQLQFWLVKWGKNSHLVCPQAQIDCADELLTVTVHSRKIWFRIRVSVKCVQPDDLGLHDQISGTNGSCDQSVWATQDMWWI